MGDERLDCECPNLLVRVSTYARTNPGAARTSSPRFVMMKLWIDDDCSAGDVITMAPVKERRQ